MSPETKFTDPASVEAWDCWFRWREHGALRDFTIDATWSRVAHGIASVEGPAAGKWARKFIDAFRHWRVLPETRILRVAGTGVRDDRMESAGAVVNASAFVISPGTSGAAFDSRAFVETVVLTVRLLDDVLLAADETGKAAGPRLGLIGVADALHYLGLHYDSPASRKFAGRLAAELSEGTLRGATELARERGAGDHDRVQLAQLWRIRGAPSRLVDEVLRCGMRYAELTLIDAQPRLALLANNASDALDPRVHARLGHAKARNGKALAPVSAQAQLELRAAMQPWIDAPIDYPAVTAEDPAPDEIEFLRQLARERGLRPVALRRADSRALLDEEGHEH